MLTALSLLTLLLLAPPAQEAGTSEDDTTVEASPADASEATPPDEAEPTAPANEATPLPNVAGTVDEAAPEDPVEDSEADDEAAPSLLDAPRPPPEELLAPVLIPPDPTQRSWIGRWFHQCTPDTDPCYRSRRARDLLVAAGAVATFTSVALIFSAGDRNRLGDPAMAMTGAGIIAMGAATIGATSAALRGDGPGLYDRITPPTLGLALGLGGSEITDEAAPYRLAGTFAPTFRFPRKLGRARPVGRFGGDLGKQLERDPRPQLIESGAFPIAHETKGWSFDLGLDVAFYLPYPVAKNPDRGHLGQFEIRYKPLFFFARDTIAYGGEDGEARVNQRVALTPLNLGLRWNLSPRQRFTFYLGPRWDLIAHGEPGAVVSSKPALAPIYGEAWFDIDIPLRKLAKAEFLDKPTVVGQFTVGYVHSRFSGSGINFGSIVGFLGSVVAQFALRVRPLGSPVAYQLELGATVGGGLNPFVRLGIVLPDIGGQR